MSRKRTNTSPEKDSDNKTIVIVAIIGLIGTIATGFFGFLASIKPTEISINATLTAEAKSILLSQTSVPPNLRPPDTPTSTEIPNTPSSEHESKILLDTSFQEWIEIYGISDINIVKSLGYQVDVSKASINLDLLKQYSIVWLDNPDWELLTEQQQNDLSDYIVSGGAILLVDFSDKVHTFLIKGAIPDAYYQEEGADIRLYNSAFGRGRIAWVFPKIANPYLYIDSANQETALEVDKVRQILNWLETGIW